MIQKSLAVLRQGFKFNSLLSSFFVAAVEFVDTTGGVNKFLFAGEEGVALGADTDFVFRTGGLDVPDFAAGAGDDGILISRMDVFFHFSVIPIVKLVNQNNFVRIQI